MSVKDLEILIYTIRNLYDERIFREKNVYPEALNNQKSIGKLNYSFKWRLNNYSHFRSFHQVLLPLSMFTATKKFNLRREVAKKQ
jgi:hypothetical protein